MQVRSKVQVGAGVYQVQPGDTLRKISKKYYGTVNGWQKICATNKLADCNKIYTGNKLWIPD